MNSGHWCIVALFCVIALQSGAVPIPTDKDHSVSLDGTWRFKLEQSKDQRPKGEGWQNVVPIDYPKEFEPFYKTDYTEDSKWTDLKVPGNWEMAGFSPATYNEADNSSGFYRVQFEVPKAWEGNLIKLNFDGVQNGCELWLNGQPVDVDEPSWGRKNYHEGGWVAFQADLTPAVKFGEKNLLALRVTKNTKSSQLDTGDFYFLGGVHRPVTLFSVPKAHLEDLTIQTKLLEGDKAEVKAITKVAGGDAKVRIRIDGVENAGETTTVNHPKLWSAEYPNLYTMHVEVLGDDGKVTEEVTKRFGIREVAIKDGIFLLNGKPIKMAGICRHDVSAQDGTAVGPDLWKKDIELMKACNINAIRTSHYPYGSGFYDLCDEMGMYVADELPYCWAPTDGKELEPAFTQRARETIRRDKNHPCVLIWTVGNENKEGINLQTVADLVKEIDPTRPRDVSCMGAAKYKTEMSDSHYWTPKQMEEGAKRDYEVKHPHIYLENPNNWDIRGGADASCWELWTPILQKTWDVAYREACIPGNFLWEWQDRGVADKSPVKLYQYDERSGINYFKIKGIVDAFRNPRPWYYTLKNVYSPIYFGEKATTSGSDVSFEVENRYSFTDLANLKAKWTAIDENGKAGESGEFQAKLAPLSKGMVKVSLPKIPSAVRIDFDDASGRNVISHQYTLKPVRPKSELAREIPEGFKFPQLNLLLRQYKNEANWKTLHRHPVQVINAKASDKTLDSDLALDSNPSKVVGHVHAALEGNRFSYHIDWKGEQADVLEAGWAFAMPKQYDQFSWNRQANWTVYPDTHIARPIGTAKPDSADVSYLKMDRPDAFDFNSTKYDCNSASLTDAQGKGLRVEFNANDRHQCRGGISNDGYTLFVNKRVCAPEDLSSNVVPELFLKLKNGDSIEGSFMVGSAK